MDHTVSRTADSEPADSEPTDSGPADSEPTDSKSAEPDDRPASDGPDEPVIRSSTRGNLRDSVLGTRNLMTVAALSVVGAIMIVPLTYLSLAVAVNPRGILIMKLIQGWF